MWAVYDDSRPRVLFIERDVIIHENNDVFIFQSTFLQELIGMANISLKRGKPSISSTQYRKKS